jgi:GNAT superfamily N-acetyltransferase
MNIELIESPAALRRCYPVMAELRPQLTEPQFIDRVGCQQRDGYRLVALEDEDEIRALAGFRILEMLWCGRMLYVDDLVTHSAQRSRGYGGRLFDWLTDHARASGCAQLHLDSGVQRFAAHRFYLAQRMDIVAHHFALTL